MIIELKLKRSRRDMDTHPNYRVLDLFSGYGGFALGLRLAGLDTTTVAYVEWDPFCQKVIQQRQRDELLDDAPIWDDIKSFDGRPWRGCVDIISGGFPCQPHSVAGKRAGADDDRNLWPDTLRLISEVRPAHVILENVPGLLADGDRPAYAGVVIGELASIGYDSEWRIVSAAEAGAPHLRKRWWLVAHANQHRAVWNQPENREGRGLVKDCEDAPHATG
jgi:DNA (cytosine-5)-methyltransferase 1